MTRYQTNRFARKACVQMIKWSWTIDIDRAKRIVNRGMIRTAKSNNGGNQQTTSELAAEMAKELILSMSDSLNSPENYEYYFQRMFNIVYKDLAFDKKSQKTHS